MDTCNKLNRWGYNYRLTTMDGILVVDTKLVDIGRVAHVDVMHDSSSIHDKSMGLIANSCIACKCPVSHTV